jgi:hypothetical protein
MAQNYSSYSIVNSEIAYRNSPNIDAFGRLRVSNPFTLFDSSHRFADNGLWSTEASTGGTAVFNTSQGLMDLSVTAASGSEVIRETTKVFAYQPGKSLLVLSTFVMNAAKTGLRQRIGYYGTGNGYYLEQNDSTISFVERSSVSGAIVNTPVLKSNWNVDKMDGTGPSGVILDLTKAQILFMDLEWLGVGTVRIGFVIDGNFCVCHKFQHANIITSTYITTASLPLRYEITNTAGTDSVSILKQICSSIMSEGGYELSGAQQAVALPVNTPRTLGTIGTFYPVISLRLKSTRLDAIIIPSAVSALPTSSGNFNWQIIAVGTTTGGSWVSAGTSSGVEYNTTGTSFSGGRVVASGYFSATNQSSGKIDIQKNALFQFQLERNGLTSTPYELTLIVASNSLNDTLIASMDWEEVTR